MATIVELYSHIPRQTLHGKGYEVIFLGFCKSERFQKYIYRSFPRNIRIWGFSTHIDQDKEE